VIRYAVWLYFRFAMKPARFWRSARGAQRPRMAPGRDGGSDGQTSVHPV